MKNILADWKNRLKKGHMFSIICVLLIIVILLGIILYKKQKDYRQASENSYNLAFYELVGYVQNVEAYLAKSIISSTPEKSADTLINLWREANLAQSYLSRLPIESQELENTAKFLNQVSDYSYSLSRKNVNNEELSDEDFKNLKDLHEYSVELENTLNQLSTDLNEGRLSWNELTNKGTVAFAQQVDNISKESFSSLEENFHEYTGLIYDGAFSEHLTGVEKKGLTGEEIDENKAKEIASEFIGKDRIKEFNDFYFSENATIPVYGFNINTEDGNSINISVSKKGGHIVSMNINRDINVEIITENEANEKGKKFLNSKGFKNMRETYYLRQEGMITINYAFVQDNVVVYPDLIKVKVALDNGDIMGLETTGYLNNHEERNISNIKINKETAKERLNQNLNIESEGLAIIPTEWKTEKLCYEFKGKIDNREFLVYINAIDGKEEDILIITNTPNGILTM